jgi:1,2-diacylglycerol 3-alpha-glucosyltransferase
MKIGFFTDTYTPQINGVVSSIVSMRKDMISKGNRVFAFAPYRKGAPKERDTFYYKSYTFPLYPEYRMALFAYKHAYKDAMKRGLDIIHTLSLTLLGVASVVASKRLKVPLVGTFPTLIPEFVSLFYGRVIAFLTKPILWKLIVEFYKKCDVVTVPTEYTRKILQKKGIDSVVLSHGIDFKGLGKPRKDIREKWDIGDDEFLIIHVGRLSYEKKVEDILKSALDITTEHKNVKYLILSDGPDRKNLEHFVQKRGLQDKVTFTGFVPQEDLSSYYSQSDLFVSASPFETQGFSVIEAMYHGRPVVAVGAGALKEVLTNGRNALIYNGNVEDLTKKINIVLDDSRLCSRLSKNGKRDAREYELGKCTSKFLELYRSLIR